MSPDAVTVELPAHWWAAGLSLAERLRLPGRPASPEEGERLERARRRLDRWENSYGIGKDGHFARLLAERGLDRDGLLALLAEDPRLLAARATSATARPAWADTVEAVLRGMVPGQGPAIVTPPDGEVAWQAGFLSIVSPFVDFSVSRFTESAHADGLDEIADVHELARQLGLQLSESLAMTASRTLVLELNVLRVTKRLHGDDAQQRFWSFVEHFSSRNSLTELVAEYVVLARLLAQSCDQAVEALLEMLARLAKDRAEVVTSVFEGVDPGRLAEAKMGGVGDSHQGGRSVGILRFENGARLVYKPRRLSVHRHVNDVIGWLNGHLPGYGLRTLTVVDSGAYGWVGFVEYDPGTDLQGIRRFYRSQGSLLAMLYALDGVDFHYENLIASGDQPILVDLESVFHPELPNPSGFSWLDSDPAAAVLSDSVSRVGLLPSVVWSEDGEVMDLGGVGADAGQTMPFKTANWSAAGTDEMHLVREHLTFPGSQNRPSMDGHAVNPGHFSSELIEGFRAGYEAIVAHRSELLGPEGLLERFADDEIRVVVRATRIYGTLLTESTHPDVLRDALDRDRVFDFLWALSAKDPVRLPVAHLEIEELWTGDIPMFVTRPATRDVWNGQGVRIPAMLYRECLAHAAGKIQAMAPGDLALQQWIIEASMATRPDQATAIAAYDPQPGTRSAPQSREAVDPGRVTAAVRAIADQVADLAHTDGTRVNWLGIDLIQETRWVINPLRTDLYSGVAGVAMFLAQAARLTGDDRYADLARRSLKPVAEIVESVAGMSPGEEPLPLGAYTGNSGLAYALVHIARDLDDPALLDLIEPLLAPLAFSIADDKSLDVIGGAAGGLAALLAVHAATGLPLAMRLAHACADRLLEAARPQEVGLAWQGTVPAIKPLAGFSHGASGIGWALARFAAVSGSAGGPASPYAEAALGAFTYERGLYDEGVHNWPDYRDTPEIADETFIPHMQAWCHGAPGVGMVRADLLRHAGNGLAEREGLSADLDLALASYLAVSPGFNGHSLCHGELGNMELLTAAIAAGRGDLVEERDRRLGVVLGQLESGPRCGTPAGVPTPGFMSGLSGIGYGLMRHAFPDRVPSVLLFEPPAG
ncbi:lanthionine synthetase [Planotetraspora thailandica]|uniref:Lanthionine synthetase n=1 Tax=Planotetraspora thailandica TaxID=487172 RepID=A0A8J3V0V8_9ACTN|nr:type 2 lanthipeptide synthetase LanM family protein [Planotetraspora thailandica]GII55393.1 lanthionine synthetase [Planotetraspora thailandica]